MCDICEIANHAHPPASHFEAGFEGFGGIIDVIKRVYTRVLMSKIDPYLWSFTSKVLYDGVEKGYGKKLIDLDYDTPDAEMLRALRQNVFMFSGFKTYQELRTMTDALTSEDGKPVSFDAFKAKALEIHSDYDIRFLEAEYDNAIKSAQSAAQWVRFQKEKKELPLLKYVTVHDKRVRLEHQALDGIIRPVDDVFWNNFFPPNGWGCRCDVVQLDRGNITPTEKIVPPEMLPMFKNNVGKSGVIFPESHPYYKVANTDENKVREFLRQNIDELKNPK